MTGTVDAHDGWTDMIPSVTEHFTWSIYSGVDLSKSRNLEYISSIESHTKYEVASITNFPSGFEENNRFFTVQKK